MLNLRLRGDKGKKGDKGEKGERGDESKGHHQVMVELMPIALGVVIIIILGLLVFLLVQHVHMMGQIAELAARR